MEPTKFENQIQEKLFSREIMPSSAAWDRLDAMLTVADEKKTKKKSIYDFRKFGIAASFLIFPIIGIAIYLGNSSPKTPIQNNQTTIVTTEIEVPKTETTTSSRINEVKEVLIQSQKSLNQNAKAAVVSIINPKSVSNQNQPIVEQVIIEKEIPQPFFSEEVVVTNPKNAIVEAEIPTQKLTPIIKIKVNATSLLSQVDGELNQSYRETKLEKIARNFNTVKVALANRNNQ